MRRRTSDSHFVVYASIFVAFATVELTLHDGSRYLVLGQRDQAYFRVLLCPPISHVLSAIDRHFRTCDVARSA